jgi:diguanylate cyclase (GGDEF)-like protein
MAQIALDRSGTREGLDDPAERRAAGRMIGLLWIIGGVSGALWYLVPGAELAHWQLGLVTASLSVAMGACCALAPWRRIDVLWIYIAAGASLVVIPVVMAINGGAESPTVLYLFMASVLFGYYLPTRDAIIFLACGVLVPATPMLYDPDALQPTYIAEVLLTAPIYAGVGLAVVLAKRQLVGWRDQARRQALLDPLTGLPNRRALTDALRDAAARPELPRPLALLMVDLDDFKAVNTAHGHVGGDRVLRSVGAALRQATRTDDVVARLGGDEFAVLVTGASETDLATLSQRILEAMHGVDPTLTPSGRRLTASIGFALLTPGTTDVDELLSCADRELRHAKSRGKDRWDSSRLMAPKPAIV